MAEMTQEAFDAMQSTIDALNEKISKLETLNTETEKWQNLLNSLTTKLEALEAKAQNSPTTDPELLQQIAELKSKLETVTTKAEALEQSLKQTPPLPPKEKEGVLPEPEPKRKRPAWIR